MCGGQPTILAGCEAVNQVTLSRTPLVASNIQLQKAAFCPCSRMTFVGNANNNLLTGCG
jgi:hypothetical protein